MTRFMLYVGSRHDQTTRDNVATECEIRGITVRSTNGPGGTVVVVCDRALYDELQVLPGVTSVVEDPEGCPYGQLGCDTEVGGLCTCALPVNKELAEEQVRARQARAQRNQ